MKIYIILLNHVDCFGFRDFCFNHSAINTNVILFVVFCSIDKFDSVICFQIHCPCDACQMYISPDDQFTWCELKLPLYLKVST